METQRLKRDSGLEDAAVRDIISLFIEKWEDTSKKNSREVMSVILGKIKDACLSTLEGDDEEHLRLLHANQYISKIITQLQSSEPLLFAISGNTFEESLKNLSTIKLHAEKEEYSKDIIDRINLFQTKINDKVSEMRIKEASSNTKALIISCIIGVVAALFAQNIGEDYIHSPFESFSMFGVFFVVFLVIAVAAYAAIKRITNNQQ